MKIYELISFHLIYILNEQFIPSSSFRFVSDHGTDSFMNICQHKLLGWKANQPSRVQPPSLLEWKSIKNTTKMALELHAPDGKRALLTF